MQNVTPLNHVGFGFASVSLDIDRRLKPAPETEVVDSLPHPPDDVIGGCSTRCDDLVGERRSNDVVNDELHPPVHLRHARHSESQVVDGQPRLAHHPRGQVLPEGIPHLLPFSGAQPVGEVVFVGDVHSYAAGIALANHAGQQIPLCRAPQFPWSAVGRRLRIADRFIQSALRRSSECQPFHSFLRPSVEEDVDGAAASGESGGRNEGPEYRIFVVLPHRNHPHIYTVGPHDFG